MIHGPALGPLRDLTPKSRRFCIRVPEQFDARLNTCCGNRLLASKKPVACRGCPPAVSSYIARRRRWFQTFCTASTSRPASQPTTIRLLLSGAVPRSRHLHKARRNGRSAATIFRLEQTFVHFLTIISSSLRIMVCDFVQSSALRCSGLPSIRSLFTLP